MLTVASSGVAVKRWVWSAEGSLLYKTSLGDNDPFVVAPLNGRVPQQTVWAISNPSTEPHTLRAHHPLQRNTTPTICTFVTGHSVPSCDQVSAAQSGRYKLSEYFSKLSRQSVGFTSNCLVFFTLFFFRQHGRKSSEKKRNKVEKTERGSTNRRKSARGRLESCSATQTSSISVSDVCPEVNEGLPQITR